MFKSNNIHGKGRLPGSKNKKTIVKESLSELNKIGIDPLQVSKEMIDTLVNNTQLSNKEQIALLGLMTNLFKYSMLTRAEEIKLDELQTENQELKDILVEKENIISQCTPQEILKNLKEQ